MKRFKKWLRKILLYLLKKLKMPRPFTEFTIADMKRIQFSLEKLVYECEGLNTVNLYNLPMLINGSIGIHYDGNNDFRTIQYTYLNNKASININSNYDILTIGIDENTTKIVTDIAKKYLTINGFIN